MNDVETLARTIFGEARGELYGGQVAVANVIMNRVARPGWWGSDIVGVCIAPSQFSCWNSDDPNRRRILDLDLESRLGKPFVVIATAAIAGALVDVTFRSTHYYAAPPIPYWARGKKPVIEIGRHRFHNNLE